MTVEIPASYHDLFENPLVATLVTLMPDGTPQATVVWCRLHDGHIQIAILKDTQKYTNLSANPQVTVLVVDTNAPFRYIEVRGVAKLSEENATAIITDIATKYGRPNFDVATNAHQRVILTITATTVNPHG